MGAEKYPKYSVLMTVYAKEKPEYLKEAIDSMLNQTIKPAEFTLVEDGPLTDELYFTIKQYEKNPIFKIIKLEKNQGSGLAAATGILECTNSWIARLDSDDVSELNRIEEQMKIIEYDKSVDIIGTDVNEFEDNKNNVVSRVCLPREHRELEKFAKSRCPLRNSTILAKKEKILEAGNYQELRYAEDYDLYIRMMQKGHKFYNIQIPLVSVRTDKNFFKRRGGLSYAKLIHAFKKKQYKRGFFTWTEYITATYPHLIVTIMPNSIREIVYKKLLRK